MSSLGRLLQLAAIVALAQIRVLPANDRPSASAPNQSPTAEIDFNRDVAPLFKEHCIRCHGPVVQRSGLRLDQRAWAARGGKSGRSLLGGAVAANPIWQRITADDPKTRMPPGAEPLGEKELDLIKRWILADTPWPEDSPIAAQPPLPSPAGFWPNVNAALDRFVAFQTRYALLKHCFYVAVGVLVSAAVCNRAKRRAARRSAVPAGAIARTVDLLGRVRHSQLLAGYLAYALIATVISDRRTMDELRAKSEKLAKLVESYQQAKTEEVYGVPPIPFRPSKPPEIHSTYYRGNCERNPKLFNNGNYRTATFYLGLFDADKKRLDVGRAVGPGPLLMRLEIERAPGTAPGFFLKEMMRAVCLTDRASGSPADGKAATPRVLFEETKPNWNWTAFYPIGKPAAGASALTGLVYLATGDGKPAYGIRYELQFKDGTLLEGSDLWMSELTIPPNVEPPRAGVIPRCEWFDYRPIQVIVGKNTDDPTALGLDPKTGRPIPIRSAR